MEGRVRSPCRVVLAELGLEAAMVRPRLDPEQAGVYYFVISRRAERAHRMWGH